MPASIALQPDSTAGVMLEGQALLDRARALSNRPEDQIARGCGYVGPSGRLLKKSFYRALVAAKGFALPASLVTRQARASGLGQGRQAEFRTRVHGNGNVLIGHAYTRRLGLEPGQEFRIELHAETGSIWLTPLEPETIPGASLDLNPEPPEASPDNLEASPGNLETSPGDPFALGFSVGDDLR